MFFGAAEILRRMHALGWGKVEQIGAGGSDMIQAE